MKKIIVKLKDPSSCFQDLSQKTAVVGKAEHTVFETSNVLAAISGGALIKVGDAPAEAKTQYEENKDAENKATSETEKKETAENNSGGSEDGKKEETKKK